MQRSATCFLNIIAKQVLRGEFSVETAYSVPAPRFDTQAERALCSTAKKLLIAGKFESGVLHAKWIMHEGRPHLGEYVGHVQ